jgi:hypothetical protein
MRVARAPTLHMVVLDTRARSLRPILIPPFFPSYHYSPSRLSMSRHPHARKAPRRTLPPRQRPLHQQVYHQTPSRPRPTSAPSSSDLSTSSASSCNRTEDVLTSFLWIRTTLSPLCMHIPSNPSVCVGERSLCSEVYENKPRGGGQ